MSWFSVFTLCFLENEPRRPGVTARTFTYLAISPAPTTFFETGSLIESGACRLTRLADKWALTSDCLCSQHCTNLSLLFSTGNTYICFYVDLGIWTQVIMLVMQEIYLEDNLNKNVLLNLWEFNDIQFYLLSFQIFPNLPTHPNSCSWSLPTLPQNSWVQFMFTDCSGTVCLYLSANFISWDILDWQVMN